MSIERTEKILELQREFPELSESVIEKFVEIIMGEKIQKQIDDAYDYGYDLAKHECILCDKD